MDLKRLSLEKLIVRGATLSLLIAFTPIALFLMFNYVGSIEKNLIERGRSIARTVEGNIINPLLLNDKIIVYEVINNAIALEEDISYIIVEDSRGRTIAHTFYNGEPKNIRGLREGGDAEVRYFRTERGLFAEITTPIADGLAGNIHIGISRERAVQAKYLLTTIISISLTGSLIIVLVSSWIVANNVSRPLRRLESILSEYPKKDLPDSIPDVSGTREVESLKKAVQEMVQRMNTLEHERMIMQKHMIYTERFAALGELASALTHEIRNPLDGMLECIRYLEAHPDKEEYRKKFLPMIQEGLLRINKVMQHMLTYARSGEETSIELCQTSEVMDMVIPMLEGKIRSRNIDLTFEKPGTCKCMASKNILMQILLNLILNSMDAVSKVQNPRIYIKATCDLQWVYIIVEDNGHGIEDSLRDRIFEPFFTTKPMGEGTGLGLAISRQLIRSIGGELELDTKPVFLSGARFVIRVPRVHVQENSICLL